MKAISGIGIAVHNLGTALALLAGRRGRASRVVLSHGVVFVLLCLLLAGESLVAFLNFYPAVVFSIWGVHSFAFIVCALMVAAGALVYFARAQWRFERVLTIWVSGLVCILLPATLLTILLWRSDRAEEFVSAVSIIAIALNVLLIYRIARIELHLQVKRAVTAAVFTCLFFGAITSLAPRTSIWVYDWSVEYDQYVAPVSLNTEDVYYRQTALLAQATDSVAAGINGKKELYFLGFGGESDNVFKNEILTARSIVDEKLGTQGRSAVLINNVDTAGQYPLASVHNLREMLNRIEQKMNTEEDVLLLFLSSHGSPDHTLSVELDNLDLNQLHAENLASIVNASEIKWRVIVVSACYSGGFIEPLKNDHTVVITAARYDRTSFGCASENEFTYFGDAYFNQAIQSGLSLLESYDEAKLLVQKKEQKESLTPSEPQIFIGTQVHNYMDDFNHFINLSEVE